MFRGIVALGAALLASAPASAVVVYQYSGVLPVGESRLIDFQYPVFGYGLDGHYRVTFVAEDLASFDLKSCLRCRFYWATEVTNIWIQYENGLVYDSGDNYLIGEGPYKSFSSIHQYDFDSRFFVDNVDEQGNGYLDYYTGLFNFDVNAPVLDKPMSYTYTVERFTLPPVPEPATWAMMIAGLGMAGVAMRRRRASVIRA